MSKMQAMSNYVHSQTGIVSGISFTKQQVIASMSRSQFKSYEYESYLDVVMLLPCSHKGSVG